MKTNYKIFLFIFYWIFFLFLSSTFQKYYLDNLGLNYLPNYLSITPDFILDIKKSLNPIENKVKIPLSNNNLDSGENYLYLEKFFQKLNQLEKGEIDKLRILHYGDSIIWADILTYNLKDQFQSKFGNGGRGLVPAYYKLERTLLDHKNLTSEDTFRREKIKPWGKLNPNVGFTGDTYIPISRNSYSKHQNISGGGPWSRVGLIYRYKNENDSNYINIQHEKGIERNSLSYSTSNCEIFEKKFPDSNTLNISFENIRGNYPYIDSFIFEYEKGIVYSPISMMGIELNDLLNIPIENFICGIEKYNPDLIIFQYGINESQNLLDSKERNREYYHSTLLNSLNKLKSNLSNSTLLVIGPNIRIKRDFNGQKILMPELEFIHNELKKHSKDLNIAYFDSINALSLYGDYITLQKKGIIQEDLTHLTRYGGKVLGEELFNQIINQYERYIGFKQSVQLEEKEKLREETNKAVNFSSSAYYSFLFIVLLTSILFRNLYGIKLFFLLVYSYYFYMTWNIYPIILLIFSTISDYFLGLKIQSERLNKKSGKLFLFLSLFFNLGLLFIFKYFNFALDILNHFLNIVSNDLILEKSYILLPVGISFYTFQTLSYTIDIYKGKLNAEENFIKFALYVTFFPQLVAGPIVRAKEFLPSINSFGRHFYVSYEIFSKGIFFIISGLLKKLSADWIGSNLVDKVYTTPEMFNSLDIVFAFYGYAFQIYGDFSGYSDIAIGSAMILGFHLTKNFDRPYQSQSITEFWRRWHISLGGWFRDYLYIPLGGNKSNQTYNLLVTMFLCGLWHGAAYNFLIWGIFHGSFLIFELKTSYNKINYNFRYLYWKTKIIKSTQNKFLFKYFINLIKNLFILNLRTLITFHIVLVGWLFFRLSTFKEFQLIKDSFFQFDFKPINITNKDILIIFIAFLWHQSNRSYKFIIIKIWQDTPIIIQSFLVSLATIFCYNILLSEPRPFIYFQF
jgi:alginate O-acetyltransferase complex protein AlgI